MMRHIRRAVYKMGFRPKLGSIFHSPSWVNHKVLAEVFRKMIPEQHVMLNDHKNYVRSTVSTLILNSAKYCPICGAKLIVMTWNNKACNNAHGEVYVMDNLKGLPVLVFDFTEWE